MNEPRKGLERAIANVEAAFEEHGGKMTCGEFDTAFESRRIVNGEIVRCKYLAFPPMWFMCANHDQGQAFHLRALFEMIKLGKADYRAGTYTRLSDVKEPIIPHEQLG